MVSFGALSILLMVALRIDALISDNSCNFLKYTTKDEEMRIRSFVENHLS